MKKEIKPAEKKYKFTMLDRMIIQMVLPKESDYAGLVINGDIKTKVLVQQSELKKYGLKIGESWNPEEVKATFDYTFTQLETDTIKKGLNDLNTAKKLNEAMRHLYEMFCK